MSPQAQAIALYLAVALLAPPAISGVVVAASSRARERMPGGANRMFKAVWAEGLAMILAVLALIALVNAFVPSAGPDERSLFSALAAVMASVATRWLLSRLPWTSSLMKDLADARRRPPRSTNFEKA